MSKNLIKKDQNEKNRKIWVSNPILKFNQWVNVKEKERKEFKETFNSIKIKYSNKFFNIRFHI